MCLFQVYVNGRTFEGTGPTKKKAKLVCAERALTSFFPELMDDSVEGTVYVNYEMLLCFNNNNNKR